MEALGVRLPEWESRNGRTKLTVYRTAFVRKLNERIAAFMSTRKVGEVFTKKDYMASVPDMTEASAKKDLAQMVEQRLCRKEGAGTQCSRWPQKKQWRVVLLFGIGLSAGIELLQLLFKKGTTELDDVIHNTLGCLTGFLIWRGGSWLVDTI